MKRSQRFLNLNFSTDYFMVYAKCFERFFTEWYKLIQSEYKYYTNYYH